MKYLYSLVTRTLALLLWPAKGVVLHNSRRVRAAVLADDQILLVRSSFGSQKWSLPGGGVEKNENPMTAAARETLEEAGVIVDESKLICIGQERLPRGKKWPVVDMLIYTIKLDAVLPPRIARPYEILEAGWFDLKKIPGNHSKTLDVALEMLARSQNGHNT